MAGHQYPGEAGGAHQLPAATAGPGSQGPRYVDRAAAQSWGRDRADGEEGVSQSPTAPGQPAWTRHMGTAPRKRSPHRSLARCHSRLCPICPHVVPTEGCFPRASPWGCSGGNHCKTHNNRVLGTDLLGCWGNEAWLACWRAACGGPMPVFPGRGAWPCHLGHRCLPCPQVSLWPTF